MKKRSKKYVPKYISANPLHTFLGGMSDTHKDHLMVLNVRNHAALANLAQGRGTKADFDLIVGAINVSNVMCEQGIGNEFREQTIAARDALIKIGVRFMTSGKFIMTGDEMQALNAGMECHDTQLENVRAIDVDRAAAEVIRRVKHRINSTSVQREMAKEAQA